MGSGEGTVYEYWEQGSKEVKEVDLHPVVSIQDGHVEESKDGHSHRSFSPRQVHVRHWISRAEDFLCAL